MPPAAPRRRLLKRFVVALAVAIAAGACVRAALPWGLRHLIEWQGSELLGTAVEVRDVDLEIWRGRAALAGVAIHPPDVSTRDFGSATDRPWLELGALTVEIDWAAAWDGRIHVREVELVEPRVELARAVDGRLNLATLATRAAGDEPPNVGPAPTDAGAIAEEADAEPGDATTAAAEGPVDARAPAASPTAPSPTEVGVDRLRITRGRISFLDLAVGIASPLSIEVDALTLHDFASLPAPGAPPTRLELRAEVGDAPLDLDLSLARSADRMDLSGIVRVKQLPLDHARAYVSGLGLRGLTGTLDGTVRVDTAPGVAEVSLELANGAFQQDGPGETLHVDIGRLRLRLAFESGDPMGLARAERAAIEAKGELRIERLSARSGEKNAFEASLGALRVGLERAAFEPGSAGAADALRVRLSEIALDEPKLRLAYGTRGIALPAVGGGAADATNEPTAIAAPETAETPQDTRPTAIELRIEDAALQRGAVSFVDRTVEPFARVELSDLEVQASAVSWPELVAEALTIRANAGGAEPIRIDGSLSPLALRATVAAKRIPLSPFNPYAAAFSGYAVERGQTSLSTEVTRRDEVYDTRTRIVLHDLALGSARSPETFADRFGVPLSLGLALLRDARGDVTIDVPVEIHAEGGARLELGTTIASALRQAIVSALASPLRVVGSVMIRGDEVERFVPAPLAAIAGSRDLTVESAASLDALGRILAERPGLAVRLTGGATSEDARVLDARAARPEQIGGAGDDAASSPPPTLPELARDRARLACRLLCEEHGVPAARIAVAWDEDPPGELAGVRVDLDVASEEGVAETCDPTPPDAGRSPPAD